MRSDAEERREWAAAIDEILWCVWDPIGVRDILEARAEYAVYVPGVQQLLQRAATDAEMMDHFRRIETEHMGLSPSPPQRLHIVIWALRALKAPGTTSDILLA